MKAPDVASQKEAIRRERQYANGMIRPKRRIVSENRFFTTRRQGERIGGFGYNNAPLDKHGEWF